MLGDKLINSEDKLVSSGCEQYVLDGEPQYAGWRASMQWRRATCALW